LTSLHERLRSLTPERLQGIRRGIEKESLRTDASGALAQTPHPSALGSALTHPHITTDFSESQLELVTGAHARVEDCLDELATIHQFVVRQLGAERMWAASMPCALPADEAMIPIGQYGRSNVAQAKTVYRHGLALRYGRRMQTISGIHYNWSLPGLSNADYFGLIRNFRRHSFLLLLLFGASPAVDRSFVAGRAHTLQPLGADSFCLPDATSLRMGRLGYQSDAQAELCVSYNCLDTYAASLQGALTRSYPAYEALGLRNPDGSYRQLGTSLLQIENEFYGTIRPKRVIQSGERPLHALRERGVEYVEVRCMDLNPFIATGIDAATARFLDIFLLHCLLTDSPPDSPAEIAELGANQQIAATRGRAPDAQLQRAGRPVALRDWAAELLDACAPIAATLDAGLADQPHRQVLQAAQAALQAPDTLPSARVLAAIRQQPGQRHVDFVREQSARVRQTLLDQPWSDQQQARWEQLARDSLAEQARIEAADTLPFEAYRQHYLSSERLTP
jgi:glutamate--cysteine ligase